MAERRAIDSALKWLYGNENERADEPPPRKNRARRKQKSAPRHDRKCCVCRHRERAEIESEFLHWRSSQSIAKEYGIAHHSSIYRHAHATGLFAKRATHLRLALEPIIEQAAVVQVTADSIIRAVALCARLTDDGEWINPPKHVVHHAPKADSSRPFAEARRRNNSSGAQTSEDLNVAPGSLARQPFDAGSATGNANPNSENAASTP